MAFPTLSDNSLADLSTFKGRVAVTGGVNNGVISDTRGERSLRFGRLQSRIVNALLVGDSSFSATFQEAAFAQLARFYLLNEGKLSRYLDYDKLIPPHSIPLRPEEVSVVLTKLCNLRCLHCYNNSGAPHPSELSTDEKLQLVETLSRWGITRLTITGGEPTLDPAFEDVLRIAANYRVGVKVSTNGWDLSASLLSAIRKGTIGQINISVDGADSLTHDSFRKRRGSFDRVIRSLSVLKENPPRILVLNVSIHRASLSQMEALTKIGPMFDATAISFKAITNTGRLGIEDTFTLNDKQIELFKMQRERLRETYGHLIEIDGKLITDDISPDLLENVSCNAGHLAMIVDADGRMLPCESVSYVSDAPNFRQMTPMQAWLEDPMFNWFRGIRATSTGVCGSAGCPGLKAKSLVQLSK